MKRYGPKLVEDLGEECFATMTERANGGFYHVSEVDARIAELEKALQDIAEECEYPACALSPAEIAKMARSVL